MGHPLGRIYVSIAFFLLILWLGMVGWAAWSFSPQILQIFSVPQLTSSNPALQPALGVNVPGIKFYIYHTVSGDTFSTLSRKLGLTQETLRSLNEFNNGKQPDPGTTLLIPSRNGIFHVVRMGQSLADIANAYGIPLSSVLEANHVTEDLGLESGEILYLPGARYLSSRDSAWQALLTQTRQKIFMKPTTGRITDGFGERIDPINGKLSFHPGLDIAPGWGARVVAAQKGKVIFAGMDGGYGELIIIDHGQHLTTRYAHLEKILVKVGQVVQQGELIGRVGATGRATGPHLHFEVRLNGVPENPLLYLVP